MKSNKDIEAVAKTDKDALLAALTSAPGNLGCELLVRRAFPSSKSKWMKMPLKADFSRKYRAFVQEGLEKQFEAEISLLKYDAVIEGEYIGVASTEEIDDFLSQLPAKGSTPQFAGTEKDASSQNERCVRIKIPGVEPILAFGQTGMSLLGDYSKSIIKIPVVYDKKDGVQLAPSGLLNLTTQTTFVAFRESVFVFKNSNFAKMTGFREVILERAKAACMELNALSFLKLADPKALRSLIEKSPDFARRISASAARGYIKNLSKAGLKNLLTEFGVTFYEEDKKGNILLSPDLENSTEKAKFLKVLTQVFVICAATGEKLEAPKAVPYKK